MSREPGPIIGHPSIAPKLADADWPTWAEIDAVAEAHTSDPLMTKIIRAAHGGMMHGRQGVRLLYDIRHAMGFSDLHGLDQLAADIAEMRKSYLWGPIEYAPKDGTHVLVKFEDPRSPPTVAHWFADDPALGGEGNAGWYLSVQQYAGAPIFPTHWQRLPAENRSTPNGQ